MNNFTENDEFEVLIVGGGVIGLSIARELQRSGVSKIAIIERNVELGRESSHAAAGMLTPQTEADFADDFFNFACAARDFFPDFAGKLYRETLVPIEFDRTGTIYPAFNETEAEKLEARWEWQQKAGLSVEKLSRREILELEPHLSENVVGGLRFPLDWQVENRRMQVALARFVREKRCEMLTHVTVENLYIKDGKVCGVKTDGGEIYAKKTIIASGAWTSLIADELNILQKLAVIPVRGQILCFEAAEQLFSHVIQTAHGYLVPRRDGRILVGATIEEVGFDKQTTREGASSNFAVAAEISPNLKDLSFQSWAGLRPKVADGLPVLGEINGLENLLMATAHYRNGILLAPLTARIIAEKIVNNQDSEFLQKFSPNRFLAKSIYTES